MSKIRNNPRVTFHMPVENKLILKKAANRKGISVSRYVRNAIHARLVKDGLIRAEK